MDLTARYGAILLMQSLSSIKDIQAIKQTSTQSTVDPTTYHTQKNEIERTSFWFNRHRAPLVQRQTYKRDLEFKILSFLSPVWYGNVAHLVFQRSRVFDREASSRRVHEARRFVPREMMAMHEWTAWRRFWAFCWCHVCWSSMVWYGTIPDVHTYDTPLTW